MPRNRDEESDEFDDEFDDEYDEELDDENGETDDEEEILNDPRMKKLYETIKAEAEKAVVEELVKEDTNSPFYKGMQKAMSKKDQELKETRMALSSLAQQINTQGGASGEQTATLEVLTEALKELLDDDGKAVLASRLNQKKESNKMSQLEQQIANLTRFAQQGQQRDEDPEEEKIREYRKQATTKLKAMAKRMGVDPDDKALDYGDEEKDSLFDRMDKLERSIEKAGSSDDDEIRKARRKLNPPQTRSDTDARRGSSPTRGRSLLDEATSSMVAQMRKLNKI